MGKEEEEPLFQKTTKEYLDGKGHVTRLDLSCSFHPVLYSPLPRASSFADVLSQISVACLLIFWNVSALHFHVSSGQMSEKRKRVRRA